MTLSDNRMIRGQPWVDGVSWKENVARLADETAPAKLLSIARW